MTMSSAISTAAPVKAKANNSQHQNIVQPEATTNTTSTPTTAQPAVKKRGRRRQTSIVDQSNGLDRVFIWNLDGALIRNDILPTESHDNVEKGVLCSVTNKLDALATKLKNITANFCEQQLFLADLESADQMHIDDVPSVDEAKKFDEQHLLAAAAAADAAGITGAGTGALMENEYSEHSANSSNNNKTDNSTPTYKNTTNTSLQQQQQQQQNDTSSTSTTSVVVGIDTCNKEQVQRHHKKHASGEVHKRRSKKQTTSAVNNNRPASNPDEAMFQDQSHEPQDDHHHYNNLANTQAHKPSHHHPHHQQSHDQQHANDPLTASHQPAAAIQPTIDDHLHDHHPPNNYLFQGNSESMLSASSVDIQSVALPATTAPVQDNTNRYPLVQQQQYHDHEQLNYDTHPTHIHNSYPPDHHQNHLMHHQNHNQSLEHSHHHQHHNIHQHQHHNQQLYDLHHNHHNHNNHHHHHNHHHHLNYHNQHIQHYNHSHYDNPNSESVYQHQGSQVPHNYLSNQYHHSQQQIEQQQQHQLETRDSKCNDVTADIESSKLIDAKTEQIEDEQDMLIERNKQTIPVNPNQDDQHHHDHSNNQAHHAHHHHNHHHNNRLHQLYDPHTAAAAMAAHQSAMMQPNIDNHLHDHQASNYLFQGNSESMLSASSLDSQTVTLASAAAPLLENPNRYPLEHQRQYHDHEQLNYDGHPNHIHNSYPPDHHQNHLIHHQNHNQSLEHGHHHHHDLHQYQHHNQQLYDQHFNHNGHNHHHHHHHHHHLNYHNQHIQQHFNHNHYDNPNSESVYPHHGAQAPLGYLDNQYHHNQQHIQQQQEQHQLEVNRENKCNDAVADIEPSKLVDAKTEQIEDEQDMLIERDKQTVPIVQPNQDNCYDDIGSLASSAEITNPNVSINNIRSVVSNQRHWSQKLSLRYQKIRGVYNMYKNSSNNHDIQINSDLNEIISEIDHYTLDWRKSAIDCLRLIAESSNCTNIVVTNLPLVIAFGQLVCLGLADFFDVDQVYSAHKSGKEACLRRIRKRFGAANRCTYIIIGEKDDVDLANKLGIPFWRTTKSDGHQQLRQLHKALSDRLLI